MKKEKSGKFSILSTVISVLGLFCFAATAESIAGAQTNDAQKTCMSPELTKDKFLEMVKTIALHGDLTDFLFIEKTLHLKFKSQYSIEGDGVINTKRVIYNADSILNTPIHVSLDVTSDPIAQQKYKIIATLRFESWGKVSFHDCLQLSTSAFRETVGNGYVFGGYVLGDGFHFRTTIEPLRSIQAAQRGEHIPPDRVTSMTKQFPAKDGSVINIGGSYNLNTDDDILDNIGLRQVPSLSASKH